MATTVVQEIIARCRQDFTMASATPALIPGTKRYLTVTAGNYIDFEGTCNFAVHAASDATLRLFVNGTAYGEGASQSIVTADDTGSMSISERYGPITAAEAAAQFVVELRVGASADTLSITAATTPATFGAELQITEVTVTSGQGLPTDFPNLLLWLDAGSGVSYDGNTKLVSSWADRGNAKTLAYTAQTGNFTAGLVLTGGTSAATATIHSDTDAGSTGTLVLININGTFTAGETITDSSTGSATAGALGVITVVAGATAPSYVASVVNSLPGVYFDGSQAASLTISTLPAQATAFEIFAVYSVSVFANAGASLLNPPTANSAACLRVCAANATVNRNAFLRTSAAEYVSTTTTITSGKALGRWRYNKGTTTGAAGVNGNAEVADTSYDETLTKWAMIGTTDGATFRTGDFKLCELIIFSFVQASTEDCLSSSDIQAVRDYLNGKYRIY